MNQMLPGSRLPRRQGHALPDGCPDSSAVGTSVRFRSAVTPPAPAFASASTPFTNPRYSHDLA
ncbi:hypothetical protein [Verrucomicrobium sp. BvORR106]|uniref:hypothetical protein n=1 Tax=Verrucomicrobium sp. BvORR106 TaxID=1403819 RepID=UPI000B0FF7B4|nr:hypothetical protein [Verrucomicrobium sp. BvORR106]